VDQQENPVLQRLNLFQLQNVYTPMFDMTKVPNEQKEEFKKHAINKTFSIPGAIFLHFITFGIFTTIFCGLKHSKLPIIKPDDFSGGKAIGFLFIPLYNLYWIFVFWLRLADRINFQLRLRNQPAAVSKGLLTTAVIIMIIPYVGLLSWLILFPIVLGQIQSASNKLALEKITPY
jgi:hypothetical protein